MPTYDYRCEECGHEFEEMLTISKRKEPTEVPCDKQLHRASPICGGEIKQVIGKTGFAYDNIPSPGHPKKPPGWMTDKLKEIKKKQPGATMSVPF